MSINILNLKLIIVIICLSCYFSLIAEKTDNQDTNTLNAKQYQEKIDNLEEANKKLDSRIVFLERQQSGSDKDRALWEASLSKTNTLFTVFMGIIIFVAGFGYFGLVYKAISSLKKHVEDKLTQLEIRNLENESLLFRNIYVYCVSQNLWDSCILWATRSLLKEAEKLKYGKHNITLIKDMINNVNEIANDNPSCLKEMDFKPKGEIIKNCEQIIIILRGELNEDYASKITSICEKTVNNNG